METQKDIILVQGTRVLIPSEWEKLRAAMLTDDQRELIERWTVERDLLTRSESDHDMEEAAMITGKINRIQRYQIVCDMYLLTGMRLVEVRNFKPEQYRPSRRVISDVVCKKEKCLYSKRTVMLSMPGCDAVERYISTGVRLPPDRTSPRDALIRYAERAGIGTEGITTKMFRKTWVSWLMACMPEKEMYISASMGHSRDVLQRHYLGCFGSLPREEIEKMRGYLKGWGGEE